MKTEPKKQKSIEKYKARNAARKSALFYVVEGFEKVPIEMIERSTIGILLPSGLNVSLTFEDENEIRVDFENRKSIGGPLLKPIASNCLRVVNPPKEETDV